MNASSFAPVLCLLLACSAAKLSRDGSAASDAGASAPVTDPSVGAAPEETVTEHGTIIDYETRKPVAGLTVTDNGLSTTTNALGGWSLTVPVDALLQPTIDGPSYSHVLYPDSTSAGGDVDFATDLMPDHGTFMLEQDTLASFDTSKAVVHVVVRATGACTSVEGGTLHVLSPSGASVTYFGTSGIPQSALTTFQAVSGDRPVAVVYNVPPGSDLQLAVTHPSCTMVPFPATYDGRTYSGHVRTIAAEPGDFNAAMVVLLE